jgi:hypothetical protein
VTHCRQQPGYWSRPLGSKNPNFKRFPASHRVRSQPTLSGVNRGAAPDFMRPTPRAWRIWNSIEGQRARVPIAKLAPASPFRFRLRRSEAPFLRPRFRPSADTRRVYAGCSRMLCLRWRRPLPRASGVSCGVSRHVIKRSSTSTLQCRRLPLAGCRRLLSSADCGGHLGKQTQRPIDASAHDCSLVKTAWSYRQLVHGSIETFTKSCSTLW